MTEKKPSVFPNKEQLKDAEDRAKLAEFEAAKMAVTQEIYDNSTVSSGPEELPQGQVDAIEMMRRRTEDQLKRRKEVGIVKEPSLAETSEPVINQAQMEMLRIVEEQKKLRDEQLAKNLEQTKTYQRRFEEISNRKPVVTPKPIMQPRQTVQPEPMKETHEEYSYITELSQPNYNTAFDVIPLPSQGKTYKLGKPSVKVSYMTTADENILTSPNLLESGQFLEVIMNRKILEPTLRYKDLLMGDRNAIMIWLRATAYGEMYPVTLFDEDDIPFDTEINLNDLETKKLTAQADAEGYFDFILPSSKKQIKFKLLTCGEIDEIEAIVKMEKEEGNPIDNTSVYSLAKMLIEVDGNRDASFINNFASSMRIPDAKGFNDYLTAIEPGIDLNITVKTPRGGSISTFLPLNIRFFWPNFKL